MRTVRFADNKRKIRTESTPDCQIEVHRLVRLKFRRLLPFERSSFDFENIEGIVCVLIESFQRIQQRIQSSSKRLVFGLQKEKASLIVCLSDYQCSIIGETLNQNRGKV